MMKKFVGIFIITLLIVTIYPIQRIDAGINNRLIINNIYENKETINSSFWTYDRPVSSTFKLDFEINSDLLSQNILSSFDLRDVNGKNYVTSIKCQTGGTCWAHAVIAAMESNLLITGNWKKAGEIDEPNLAEYHLDWWNGFNTFNNDDDPDGEGLTVHYGAHCRIASAYFSRGEGAVFSDDANDETEYDANWYETPPDRYDDNYYFYYPRHIEIYDIGDDLSNINLIKNKIMTNGPINILFRIDSEFMDENYAHYQPANDSNPPNHNVVVIGWDDNKVTPAPYKGAWLCKNSWGPYWGINGYFWISYYDKYCCHYEPDEWTATFQQVEPMSYKRIYYHDYHGWQDDFNISNEAFNAFTLVDNEILTAVSFYTCTDNVDFEIIIYDQFDNGILTGELSNISGTIDFMGFHTFDLVQPVFLTVNDQFYIYLKLSNGGIPYDRTHTVWGNTIKSVSHPGESFYYYNDGWNDLYFLDSSANFCIKGLVSKKPDLECDKIIKWKKIKPGSIITDSINITNIGESFSKLNWSISEQPSWGNWSFAPKSGIDLYPEYGPFTIKVTLIAPFEEDIFTGVIRIVNNENYDDFEIIDVTLSTPRNKNVINLMFHDLFQNKLCIFPIFQKVLNRL